MVFFKGSILEQLPFLMYNNNLQNCLSREIKLFADDIAVVCADFL